MSLMSCLRFSAVTTTVSISFGLAGRVGCCALLRRCGIGRGLASGDQGRQGHQRGEQGREFAASSWRPSSWRKRCRAPIQGNRSLARDRVWDARRPCPRKPRLPRHSISRAFVPPCVHRRPAGGWPLSDQAFCTQNRNPRGLCAALQQEPCQRRFVTLDPGAAPSGRTGAQALPKAWHPAAHSDGRRDRRRRTPL